MFFDFQTDDLVCVDSRLQSILDSIGKDRKSGRIGPGLHLSTHWNFEWLLGPNWDKYPELGADHDCFGVCDSPDQFLEVFGKMLSESPKNYIVSFVHLQKDYEPKDGGWRWHKWGPYIGKQEPQCEYLANEPVITEVYTYHIYEK